eukprot:TRINITY_DN26606_c0_g1_i6.p1 TRINITY_DN26606_c0_g1~~TRINITY_DN26606_c0_g1_i6.p1  ORF type:complete len:569 (-),score=50.57 TRINITY_DN26606_c0_g1_i6:44-1750(-)
MTSWVVSGSSDTIYGSDLGVTPFRISLSLMPLRRRYVLAGSLLYDLTVSAKIIMALQGPSGTQLRSAVLMHVLMTPAFIVSSRIVEKLLMNETKANHGNIVMHVAARRLLDLLADAVLELGADLHLVVGAPKFTAMLFLNSGSHLEGALLTNFMVESSRQRFSEIMADVGHGRGPDVGALNVSFRDSLGNLLHLEAFYIHIATAATSTHYLVGLRETTQMDERFGSLPLDGQLLPSLAEGAAGSSMAGSRSVTSRAESESSSSGVGSSVGSAVVQYVVPDRLPTLDEVQHSMLGRVMKRCSFQRQTSHGFGVCCEKHQAVKELLKVILAWQHEACEADFSYNSGWQCKACCVLWETELESECPQCTPHVVSCSEESESPVQPVVVGQRSDCSSSRDGRTGGSDLADCGPQLVGSGRASTTAGGATDKQHVRGAVSMIGGAESAHSTSGSAAPISSGGEMPQLPAPTCPQVVRRLLLDTLKSWNFILGRDLRAHRCCPKHVGLQHLLILLVKMQTAPCDKAFTLYSAWQCQSCGVLDDAAPRTGRCGDCTDGGLHDAKHELTSVRAVDL